MTVQHYSECLSESCASGGSQAARLLPGSLQADRTLSSTHPQPLTTLRGTDPASGLAHPALPRPRPRPSALGLRAGAGSAVRSRSSGLWSQGRCPGKAGPARAAAMVRPGAVVGEGALGRAGAFRSQAALGDRGAAALEVPAGRRCRWPWAQAGTALSFAPKFLFMI